MTLLINILIGSIIFGYAGITLYKSIKKQKRANAHHAPYRRVVPLTFVSPYQTGRFHH